ncbi:MmcQ/YjbR family DNA-binding protein [Limibacter armeniacum]|uniref:MmcQ/YjbR family DNA-binding protein n=1 Tax=Limibacter armeniacum TaxID=466084 RepID=UPI002FE6928F
MHIEAFRDYCIRKNHVTEELPFDDRTLVFKVMGKMFALTDIEDFKSFNVKCDPIKAIELREQYNCVEPGYHMNKKHWNTIKVTGEVSDNTLFEWVDHSYDLVVKGLPKKVRESM